LKLADPVFDFIPVISDNSETFSCKCSLTDLKCFSMGTARSKKAAKADAARQTIEMIAHIPDVQ